MLHLCSERTYQCLSTCILVRKPKTKHLALLNLTEDRQVTYIADMIVVDQNIWFQERVHIAG